MTITASLTLQKGDLNVTKSVSITARKDISVKTLARQASQLLEEIDWQAASRSGETAPDASFGND